jgi:hypothetical protein
MPYTTIFETKIPQKVFDGKPLIQPIQENPFAKQIQLARIANETQQNKIEEVKKQVILKLNRLLKYLFDEYQFTDDYYSVLVKIIENIEKKVDSSQLNLESSVWLGQGFSGIRIADYIESLSEDIYKEQDKNKKVEIFRSLIEDINNVK